MEFHRAYEKEHCEYRENGQINWNRIETCAADRVSC